MHRSLLLASLPLTLLFACGDKPGGGQGADDTGGSTGGDDGGGITYDEGCITVDGEGGYAWINDAITVAEEGSTINLCAASTHEEEVVVDKAVQIVGPGAGEFLLVAPTNTAGFTITASGASLSGVSVDSTRSGIAVEGAADVTITDVEIVAAGNWGVSAEDATGLTVSESSFVGNGYGALSFDGGDATGSGLSISANVSYGIYATNDALVRIEASEISDTSPVDPDNPADGFGAYADEGAALTLVGNTWANNAFAAVRTEEADASLEGETISGSAYGVILRLGGIDLTDVSIDGAVVMGALLVTLDDLAISGLEVTTEPEASVSYAYNEWGTSEVGVPGSGVVAVADVTNIDGLAVSGFNNCGLFLQPASSGVTGVATVSNATISNTGRYGVYSGNMESSFTDSSVTGTRLVDTAEERTDPTVGQDVLCYYVNYFAGIYSTPGALDWVGGEISDNEGWGISNVRGTVSVDSMTLSNNHCAGVLGYEGTMSVANSILTGHLENSVINSNSDSLVVLDGNTFEANRSDGPVQVVYDYMDTSGYRLIYDYDAGYARVNDVALFGVAEAIVQNNNFVDGDRSLQLYGGSALVSNNTWSGYRSTVLTAGNYDGGADVEMDTNSVSSSGGLTVDCRESSLEVNNLTVSTGSHYSYSYTYTIDYGDGSPSTYSTTGSTGNIGLRGYECNLYADTATFTDLAGNAIEVLAYSDAVSTAELNDITVLNAGGDATYADSAITANNYGGNVSLYVDGLAITNAANDHGIELYGASGTTLLDGQDITVNGAAGNGVNAYAGSTADVSVSVDGLDVQNSVGDAFSATNATVAIANSNLSASSASGLFVNGGSTTVSTTVFESNTDYGMECEGDGEQTCDTVVHLTNGLGEQSGCDETCGEAPAPE